MAPLEENALFRPEILATVCILMFLYLIKVIRKSMEKNLPPGPMGLPIVGYMPFLTKAPHLKFARLASKYGNIFSLRLGSKLVVVLNDAESIKEAFSQPGFSGRPSENHLTVIRGYESPYLSNGKAWKEQRRFGLHVFRDLGFGKTKMENHIKEEIENLIKEIKKFSGKPFRIKNLLTPSMSNNICALVFGSRYEYDDSKRKLLDEAIENVVPLLPQLSCRAFLPWVYKIPFTNLLPEQRRVKEEIGKLLTFIRNEINRHKESMDVNNVRDYIDGYLLETEMRLKKDPQTTFSENMLSGSVINFFFAGSETVRSTIDWSLYTLAAYPDIQRKVHSEIDNVIGKERAPVYSDSKVMPYTQAVLTEIQRWQSVAPLGLIRCTTDDCVVDGYDIPKDAIVFSNIWSCHHSEKYWKDPMEFKPSRFLSDDGKTFQKSEYFMPFCYGKRACPGEPLAVVELFLYFTSILQNFSVEIPKGDSFDFSGSLYVTFQRKSENIILNSRI